MSMSTLKRISMKSGTEKEFDIESNKVLETEIHIEDNRVIGFKYYADISHSIAIYEYRFNYFSQLMERKCIEVIQKEITNLKELENFAIEYVIREDII